MDAVWGQVGEVEAELERQVSSKVALVSTIGRHTLEAGGKRLRPALVSLSAAAIGRAFDAERTVRLGACMEMIHMATLIHDDVVDHAPTRRGRASAPAAFGDAASVLSGDVLLSKAMSLLAEDGDIAIIRRVSGAVVEMAEGEVLELEKRGCFNLSEEEYRRILAMKTAAFIRACCEVGAMIADASRSEQEALGRYGLHVGIAFQIVDDLLDYQGDCEATGKRRACDLREGSATLPLILLRDRLADSEERRFTERIFDNGMVEEDVRQVCRWMDDRGVFEESSCAADREVALAIEALDALKPSDERALMEAVAKFVISRKA